MVLQMLFYCLNKRTIDFSIDYGSSVSSIENSKPVESQYISIFLKNSSYVCVNTWPSKTFFVFNNVFAFVFSCYFEKYHVYVQSLFFPQTFCAHATSG